MREHKVGVYIIDLMNHGLTDHEVSQYLTTAECLVEVGHIPTTEDLVGVIRLLLETL